MNLSCTSVYIHIITMTKSAVEVDGPGLFRIEDDHGDNAETHDHGDDTDGRLYDPLEYGEVREYQPGRDNRGNDGQAYECHYFPPLHRDEIVDDPRLHVQDQTYQQRQSEGGDGHRCSVLLNSLQGEGETSGPVFQH